MLNQLLHKLALKFAGKSFLEYPVEKQKKYIERFREPRSNIERSFFQYKAQMTFKSFWIVFFANIASVPLLLWYFLIPNQKPDQSKKSDAVFVLDGNLLAETLPNVLREEYKSIEICSKENHFLNNSDRKYIFQLLLTHPFSWLFILKSTIKIMRYRWIMESYSPKALIVNNEYSFTSSMLTDFCNKNCVELINVMHGEKLFNITDSFFAFNRCYVWDEFYRDLFLELRAEPSQFRIAVPPSLIFESKNVEKEVNYTYYLQAQKGEKLAEIVNLLKKIKNDTNRVVVRPHPRFTNLSELEICSANSGIEIENFKEVPIEISVMRTKNVISVYSTVLQQAYYNKIGIVIDDVSNPELIRELAEHQYIMLNVEHTLLSDVMRAIEVTV